MENDLNTNSDKKTSKKILLINLVVVLIMGLCGIKSSNDSNILLGFLGIIAGGFNFVFMLAFIIHRKTIPYITCMICMLLLFIIGFGCCSVGYRGL